MPKKSSQELYELMTTHDLELPHGPNLQYAKVFSSNSSFQEFFRAFEQQVSRNKLWLNKEVRFHLELMQGISLDSEFKGLIAHLEVLMVDSIYHFKIDRVKRSLMRNGFMNRDTKKPIKVLDEKTLLGAQREQLISLIAAAVYSIKGLDSGEIDLDRLSDQFPD